MTMRSEVLKEVDDPALHGESPWSRTDFEARLRARMKMKATRPPMTCRPWKPVAM